MISCVLIQRPPPPPCSHLSRQKGGTYSKSDSTALLIWFLEAHKNSWYSIISARKNLKRKKPRNIHKFIILVIYRFYHCYMDKHLSNLAYYKSKQIEMSTVYASMLIICLCKPLLWVFTAFAHIYVMYK